LHIERSDSALPLHISHAFVDVFITDTLTQMPAIFNRRFRGEFTWNNDGGINEYRCMTCVHNNEVIIDAPARKDTSTGAARVHVNWDYCLKCNGPICLKCAAEMARTGECVPWELRLQIMENPPAWSLDKSQAVAIGKPFAVPPSHLEALRNMRDNNPDVECRDADRLLAIAERVAAGA
jgi:hypothetical protein